MPNKFGHLGADGEYARRPWNPYLTGTKYGDTPGFATDGDPANGPSPMAGEVVRTDRIVDAITAQAPTPQRPIFRPRFGYDDTALSIEDVINVDALYRVPRVANEAPTGGPGQINSTSTPSLSNTLGNA